MPNFFTKITKKNNDADDQVDFDINENEQNEPEKIDKNTLLPPTPQDEEWLDKETAEGQLSVDVFQTKDTVVIKSTIAGVKPEDIDIAIDNDVITIRGQRKEEESVKDDDYFYQECYWGSFSRSVVLPMEVKSDEAEASLKNGVLTVVLPKAKKNKSVAVKVTSE
jgi:HSP20 family protein